MLSVHLDGHQRRHSFDVCEHDLHIAYIWRLHSGPLTQDTRVQLEAGKHRMQEARLPLRVGVIKLTASLGFDVPEAADRSSVGRPAGWSRGCFHSCKARDS